MKELNKNLIASSVDICDWKYDSKDYEYPKVYEVSLIFYGHCYTIFFSTDNIKRFEDWGLENVGCEGPSELFDSIESYFENECNEEEARTLIDMMRECWDMYDTDGVYDFVGNKR